MREKQLDGLRGLAAAGVALHHAWSFCPPAPETVAWLVWTPAYAFINGRMFVVLFFVLSGYVLARGLAAGDESAASFAVRRLCRVYLPYAAAAILGAALAAATSDAPAWDDLPGHLLMSGRTADLDINPVGWSLVYELRITLFMPLLWLAVRRNALLALVGSLAVAFAVVAALQATALDASADQQNLRSFGDARLSLVATLYYIPMFVLGAVLADKKLELAARFERLSRAGRAVLGLSSLALIWTGIDVPVAIGCAIIMVMATRPGALGAMLLGPIPQTLGTLSYSLYLTHLPLLAAAVVLLAPAGGTAAATAIGLVLVLPLAAAFWMLVEDPSRRLGRRLTHPGPLTAATP